MADIIWSAIADAREAVPVIVGFGMIVASNALRARRTNQVACLGELYWVQAREMTIAERILNRVGIALFVIGMIGIGIIAR
ncbi:MAG: hypothetical protein ABEK03_02085 [Candidatus Bipolaricaulia bacterium]